MKKIEIKLLTPAEVSSIVALDRICLGGFWTEEAYLREIESDKSTLIILRLWEFEFDNQPQIIGMACLWSIVDEAHITLLGIHPNFRRQGLGELLLFSLLEDAIARKLEWATLEVNVNNLAAINLYKKYNFQAVGTRKGYYQPAGEDALILWLKGIRQREFANCLAQWQQRLSDRLSANYYNLG